MGKYLDRAKELRANETHHYNCAQAVLMSFMPDLEIDDKTAFQIAACFGGGMKCGSVCGAITGGLMSLGVLGIDDPKTTINFINKIKNNHNGCTNCIDLLRMNKEAGGEKKPHCDSMVYESVKNIEELIEERNKNYSQNS